MDQFTVKVGFLGATRSLVKRRELEVALTEGSTLEDLLGVLCQQLGDGFARQLFGADGTLLRHVSIFVNGRDVKGLEGLETKLAGGEVDVLILPTYGGG
jgi:molybdopterin synthase sulfur carrier subunit